MEIKYFDKEFVERTKNIVQTQCKDDFEYDVTLNQCADRNTHRYPGTDSDTHADTFGNTCCYPRADSCPYAGTHGSADGRTCPGAGEHELWCCAL